MFHFCCRFALCREPHISCASDSNEAELRSASEPRENRLSRLALSERVHEPSKPDDGQLFHIPGSTKSYTDTQINRSTSTVDWFPDFTLASRIR